jgi:hypothetical protein
MDTPSKKISDAGVNAVQATNCDAIVETALAPYNNAATAQKKIISDYRNQYYKSIEAKNSLPNEDLSLESAYFITKYGKYIYSQLLDERTLYITPPTPTDTTFDMQSYGKALESIHVLNQVNTIDSPLYNVLDTYLHEYDSNTIYREVEYRTTEYAKLSAINYYINILYYCLFVILILVLFSSNRLFLSERFMAYIFLAILPILYPWVFMLFRRIFMYIYPSLQYNGPVNAFVDTTKSTKTMFSNNVSNSYKKDEPTTTI